MKVEKKEELSISLECFRSRNIFSYLDLHESSKQYKILKKHIDKCDICRKKMSEFKKIHQSLDGLIPFIEANKPIQESYENEIHEIMKSLMRKYNERNKFNIKRLTNFFMSFIASKNTFIVFIAFTVLGLVLKGL